MHDPNYDPSSIPVAAMVEPEDGKLSIGCILAIIFSVFGVLGAIAMGVVAYFVMSDLSGVEENNRTENLTESALREEAIGEFARTKTALLKPANVNEHPQYSRIQKFVTSAQTALDETANLKFQNLVDYDGYLAEMANRSKLIDNNRLSKILYVPSLKANIVGPSPFNSFEILQIEEEGPDRFRVYLSCRSDYQSEDPFIWWLSDIDNRLKIYDWEQLEFGLRAALESAIIADCSGPEEAAYDKYVTDAEEYFDSYYGEASDRNPERIRQILERCEQFAGPQLLRPNVRLVTAYHWYTEGENDRALELLKSFPDDQLVPGVHRLRGEIYLEREQYEDAAKSFQQFTEILGPIPFAQSSLASCYRELGDTAKEREAILATLVSISENDYASMVHLMELNSASQNEELFAQIDELDNREEVYSFLIQAFDGSSYFADKLEQLVEHLSQTIPDSRAAQLGKTKLKSGLEGFRAGLKWIDQQPEHDEDVRYDFWYGVDEEHIVALFESSDKKDENFDTISSINDYEGGFSDEIMIPVCISMLKINPEKISALYQLGSIYNLKEEFDSAMEYLTKAEKLLASESEMEPAIRYQLMLALHGKGDHDKAIKLAVDHEIVTELIALMHEADDFSRHEELLKHLDPDSNDFKYHNALLVNHNGDFESALTTLAELVKTADNLEEYSYNVYQYREQMFKICQKLNDPTRAVLLVPTRPMFYFVSDRLVQNFDWSNCEKLLKSRNRQLKDDIFQLQQSVYWEQGQYDKVLRNAKKVISLAEKDELEYEFVEQLVRSAIRLQKFDAVREYAESYAELSDRNQHLLLLVSLLQGQSENAISQFRQLPGYQQSRIFYDPDLSSADLREVVSMKQLPPRQLGFASFFGQKINVVLLFKQPVELSQEQLSKTLEGFDENIRVEKVESKDALSQDWFVTAKNHRILVSQRPLDEPDEFWELNNKKLKEAIFASRYQIRIRAQEIKPTTREAIYNTSIALIRRFMSSDTQAIGDGDQWLTAADVTRYLEQAKDKKQSKSRLFSAGEFLGEFHYFDDATDYSSSSEFIESLSDALRKFRDSDDPGKKLVVQTNVDNIVPERISATVDQIKRTEYRSVELVVTVQEDSKYDGLIRKGDRFLVPLYKVDGFELTTSGAVTKQSKSSQ